MELDPGRTRKPIRQLRKSLMGLSSDPPQQDVHDLRTRTRRVEALAASFISRQGGCKRQFLKALKPVLKVAGEVRDMDVLAAKARTLARPQNDESVDRLLAHFQAVRVEKAGELMETVARRRRDACRSLKQLSRQIEGRLHRKRTTSSIGASAQEPVLEAANRLMGELSLWPAFNADNLHAFRVRVKELHSILRFAEGANPQFAASLEKVKTRVGEWHDWHELKIAAGEILDPSKHRTILDEIVEIECGKFRQALKAAQALRSRYLGAYGATTMTEP